MAFPVHYRWKPYPLRYNGRGHSKTIMRISVHADTFTSFILIKLWACPNWKIIHTTSNLRTYPPHKWIPHPHRFYTHRMMWNLGVERPLAKKTVHWPRKLWATPNRHHSTGELTSLENNAKNGRCPIGLSLFTEGKDSFPWITYETVQWAMATLTIYSLLKQWVVTGCYLAVGTWDMEEIH